MTMFSAVKLGLFDKEKYASVINFTSLTIEHMSPFHWKLCAQCTDDFTFSHHTCVYCIMDHHSVLTNLWYHKSETEI